MKKKLLAVSMLAALLVGCDSADLVQDKANVIIKTQSADSFAAVDNSEGNSVNYLGEGLNTLSNSVDCTDFVRAMNSGEIEVPDVLAPAFEFPNPSDDLYCNIESVVVTKENLYLQGQFWNFMLAPEVSEDEPNPEELPPINLSCDILKVPMWSGSNRGGYAECIGESYDGDKYYRFSQIALGKSRGVDTLYFMSHANYGEDFARLWYHNDNEGLVEVAEVPDSDHVNAKFRVHTPRDGGHVLAEFRGAHLFTADGEHVESFGEDWDGIYEPPLQEPIHSNARVTPVKDRVFTDLFKNGTSNLVIDLNTGEYGTLDNDVPFSAAGQNMPANFYGDDDTGNAYCNRKAVYHALLKYNPETHSCEEFHPESNNMGVEYGSNTGGRSLIYFSTQRQGDYFDYATHVLDMATGEVDLGDVMGGYHPEYKDADYAKVIGQWSNGVIVELQGSSDGWPFDVYLNHTNNFELYDGEVVPLHKMWGAY